MIDLPPEAQKLTEATSIALLKQIESQSILTPLSDRPISTTYVSQGQGKTPILLLHGFDSSVLEFRRLLPRLAQVTQVWAVDLLGFGFTQRLAGLSFSPAQIKTHLYTFWQTQIQKPVILVGASMGGATALDFTLTYPEAVEKLVLLDSAGLVNPPIVGKFMFPPLDILSTAFLRNPRVRHNISRAAYYDKRLANQDALLCTALHLQCPGWSQALIAFTKSGGYGSLAQQLSSIEQPTLILWGDNDKILGTKDALRFEQLLPSSQLIWIEQCGHVPHLEKPDLTAERISNCIKFNADS
jgi:pimeloyl-ACP methyl ester carboxylesterase